MIFGCLSDLLQFPKVNHSQEIISYFEFPKKKGNPIRQHGRVNSAGAAVAAWLKHARHRRMREESNSAATRDRGGWIGSCLWPRQRPTLKQWRRKRNLKCHKRAQARGGGRASEQGGLIDELRARRIAPRRPHRPK
jgi:hypothetical protein